MPAKVGKSAESTKRSTHKSRFMASHWQFATDKLAVDVHVGGFASYDFSGELKPEYEDHINSTSKYGNNIKDTNTDNSTDIGDLDG